MYLLGFDIGGTKCAAVTAEWDGENIKLLKKAKCVTDLSISPYEMLERLISLADGILEETPASIGVSCGGPLDLERGAIMSPPNLLGWDDIEIVKIMREHYGVPAHLQNDANACAVAEWKFGAGRGYDNVVFLTFGTGLGAGLILGGKLYCGANGNAGEVGHIRLSRSDPVGYGKEGSFEGFCSGGGIARLGYAKALEKAKSGEIPLYYKEGMTLSDVTAKSIAEAARAGDTTAKEVFFTSGEKLGAGISVIMDILNPDVIVIGSIFARCEDLLAPAMYKKIAEEALDVCASSCRVLPALLGENIGDYAAIATALL